MNLRYVLLAGSGFAAINSMSATASAQEQSQTVSASDERGEETEADRNTDTIVVTGTLIRGVKAPTGANLLTVSEDEIEATGAASATDVLNQTVPQLPTFNTVAVGTASWASPVPKIGLRGIGNSSGSSSGQTSTLVLFNGHRVVPVGILSTDPDPNLIPADVLRTVQVMPDGGSATYGSDAIGGVVNYVARQSYEGLGFNYQHKFADNYNEDNLTLTAGTSWDSGSAYVSAYATRHDAILGKDRDYITSDFSSITGEDYRSSACEYGTFEVNGTVYSGPTPSPVATAPLCETSDGTSLVPKEERYGLFGYLEQDLSDSLSLNIDAFYSRRDTESYTDIGSIPVSFTIDAGNPYFVSVDGETSQEVSFDYSRALGESRITPQTFELWQVTPSLAWNIDDNWQLRAEFIYGESTAEISDRTGLNGSAVNATNINPYDPAQTNAAVLAALADYEFYSRGKNTLQSAQVVANGVLFEAPGGNVAVAFGGEIRRQELDNETSIGPIGDRSNLQTFPADRTIKAVFAEVQVPLVGVGNRSQLVEELSLNVAVRHDDYSDFGGTTNPRIGLDYRPFEDLVLRANYQTSFVAPSLADSGNKVDTRFQILTFAPNNYFVFIAGAGQNVRPQEGETFSIGGEWTPSGISGLDIGVTYWNTKVENLVSLSLGAFGFAGSFASDYNLCGSGFGPFPTSSAGPCTLDYLNSLEDIYVRIDAGGAPGIGSIEDLFDPGVNIAGVIDARRNNFGNLKMDGLDVSLRYSTDTQFGSVFGRLAGTYLFSKDIASAPGQPYVDYLSGETVNGSTPRYNVVGTLGASAGAFRGSLSVRHNAGYDVPDGEIVGQSSIDSYTLVDLALSYGLEEFVSIADARLSLNVSNLFDNDPPFSGAQPNAGALGGFANGSTLGRAITLGFSAQF